MVVMPGAPLLQSLEKRIAELGGDAYVFDQIANGIPVGRIAKRLGVSRPFLYVWRDRRDHPERPDLWEAAMRASGEAHVEKAERELYRNGLTTPADIALAKARSDYHRWVAGRRDEKFRDSAKLEVSGTIGHLQLVALQQKGNMSLAPARLEALPAEIVEEESQD